ncbi:MAG: ATP-dependent zinc metalloprotease FtsH [Deltaproteobacteria bacterium]
MLKDRKKAIFHAIYWAVGLVVIFVLPQLWLHIQTREITYSTFKKMVREDRILVMSINPDEIKGILYTGPEADLASLRQKINEFEMASRTDGNLPFLSQKRATLTEIMDRLRQPDGKKQDFVYFKTIRVDDRNLVEELEAHGIDYTGVKEGLAGQLLWGTLVPILFWVGLWFLLIRSMGKPGAGLLSIGKSKAKISMEKDTGVSFRDVAGCDEAKEELAEVVTFLKSPEKYEKLGAKIPKGVLLLGPPGTGKTLLAKALAGEAGVPFYSISGSEFVEMFVGVGAARVRDLFSQAKQNAPCIIFIDEIDAIGKFRSGGMTVGGHEEREQTLNQLLVEMDGFEPNIGVILLAATNRPEVLDPALLRPGRFDRQVVLDAPDVHGREAILQVHARGKPLSQDVNIRDIARRTPGFSGADLANAMNEAALLAAREGNEKIHQRHLEEAVEKVLAGPERKSRRLLEKERRRVAFHEAGHALVAKLCPNAPPVAKISIIPRGRAALGYTLQIPEEEQYLMTRSELLDKICVSMGGRIAEEIVFGEISSGAQNDLELATEIARSMVCRFGMSDAIGPMVLSREQSPFLRMPYLQQEVKALGPELAAKVDEEVQRILTEQETRARSILTKNRMTLEKVAERLLAVEVMTADEFQDLVKTGTEHGQALQERPSSP